MSSIYRKYLTCFVLTFAPFILTAVEETIKGAYKPPILTTTAIIEVYDHDKFSGIVLIERGKAPFGKAIPGGKVEYGETVENAVRREMLEEVGLELQDLKQFHVYSDPSRDFRHHSVEVTHVAKAFSMPVAGDDAAKAFVVKIEDIPWNELAFDHAQIIHDYLDYKAGRESLSIFSPDKNDRQAINQIIDHFTSAWNHSGKGFADYYSEDADFVNIFGKAFSGQQEIEERHINIHESFLKGSIFEVTDLKLREVKPGVVIAHVYWTVSNIQKPGKDHLNKIMKGIFTHVLLKNHDNWEITASQNTLISN